MRLVVVALILLGLFCGYLPVAYGQEPIATVQNISFAVADEGAERVEVKLNGAHIPNVFLLEGENPRLVLDFPESGYNGKPSIAAQNGTLVQGVRVGVHNNPKKKTRVVLDLATSKGISWNQDFLVQDNVLVITVSQDMAGGVVKPKVDPVVLKSGGLKVKANQTSPSIVANTAVEQIEPAGGAEVAVEVVQEQTEVVVNSEAKEKTPEATVSVSKTVVIEPIVLDVSFDLENADNKEMVLLKLNGFFPPEISTKEKAPPRIFCDFSGARIGEGVAEQITADGVFVKNIHVTRESDPERVRITLDLAEGNNYDLQQIFFKEDNLFILVVSLLETE